jgi:hypothetical protein
MCLEFLLPPMPNDLPESLLSQIGFKCPMRFTSSVCPDPGEGNGPIDTAK